MKGFVCVAHTLAIFSEVRLRAGAIWCRAQAKRAQFYWLLPFLKMGVIRQNREYTPAVCQSGVAMFKVFPIDRLHVLSAESDVK
jgi:hypothetical protein